MGKEKYEAIVLKAVKYGEHDKMLTLFTKQEGKLSAVAKGALSHKSKYIASAQVFCLSEFVLSVSAAGKMPYVVSADVLRGYYGLNKDLERMAAASYCAELTDLFYEDKMGEPVTFQLLYYTLLLLERADLALTELIALAFTLKLMGICGTNPSTERCISCGREVSQYAFDFNGGGILCPNCKPPNVIMPYLSDKEALLLHGLLHIDIGKLEALSPPDRQTLKYLLKLLNDYIKFTFNKKINSFSLLYSI